MTTRVPLHALVMFDQSSSMSDAAYGGSTKWDGAKGGLNAFVSSPKTLPGLGLAYFGQPAANACPFACVQDTDCGACGPCFFNVCLGGTGPQDSCDAADYTTPEVAILPPAQQAAAFMASLNNHAPSTSTPTSAALQGAVNHAKTWAMAHPTVMTDVILITDGDPTECNTDPAAIAAIAAAGATTSPAVRTHVVAVGALNTTDQIAAGGGTGMAWNVDIQAGPVAAKVEEGLDNISASYQCTFVPAEGGLPMAGATVNALDAQATPTALVEVADAGACAGGTAGWYPNNGNVVLCPSACATAASVEIALPCL